MRSSLACGAVLAALLLVPAGAQASCAVPQPPAQRLAQSDAAFAGTVVAVSQDQNTIRYRVDRAVKGDLPPELDIYNPGNTSIAMRVAPGDRMGLFLRQEGVGYGANDCTRTGHDDIIAAGVPAPCRAGAKPAARPRRQAYVRVLGCAQPLEGAGFQVLATRRAKQKACLRLAVLPSKLVAKCADAGLAGAQAFDVDGVAGRTVYGTADDSTQGIVVRYRAADGSEAGRSAGLVVIAGANALKRLGIKRPVQQYAVHLPAGATPLRVERHGFGGATSGSIPLEG